MSSARVLKGKRKRVRRKIRDLQVELLRTKILSLLGETKLYTRLKWQKARLHKLNRMKKR